MKATLRMSVAAALGLATLVSPLSAAASTPLAASGTFVDTGGALTAPPREAGGNLILQQQGTAVLTGTFSGTVVADFTAIVHPTGLVSFSGTELFVGEVDGRPGTLLWRVRGTIDGTAQEGHLVVIGGTGDLWDLHAVGSFEGTAGVGGTYSVLYHFDP